MSISPSEARGQPAESPASPLLTPGSVALLVGQLDAASVAKLRTALTHEDPIGRAIAARIAGIQKMTGMAPDLARAFEREVDEWAAAEQVRALLFVDHATWRETIERRLSATQPLAVHAYVEWIVRNRPELLADHMADVYRWVPATELDRFSPLVSAAIRHYPAMTERFLRGWLRIAPGDAWRSVVSATGDQARDVEAPVLREALDAPNADVRQETVWAIVSRIASGRSVAPAVLDAALPRASAVDTPVTWETVGRELVARIHQGGTTPDRADIYKAEAAGRRVDVLAAAKLPQLTIREREVLKGVFKDTLPQPAPATRTDPPQPEKNLDTPRSMPIRTVPIPWPGFLEDLLRASACPVTNTSRLGAFTLSFRPDGRPERGDLTRHDLPAECDPALAALARLTLADIADPISPGAMQAFVLPLNKGYVTCVTDMKQVSRVRRTGSGVEPPRKIHDVRPSYPPLAQQNRVQGLVVVEATMSVKGCVLSVAVLRGAHPFLDMAALQAVSAWRFTPALLAGEPVPAMMTVSVNFTLQ